MVATFTPSIAERIDADRRERTARLAAQARHLETERDHMGGGWIVRNPKIPARIEIVSDAGQCSCRQFFLWDRCKHAALVETRHGGSWQILEGGKR